MNKLIFIVQFALIAVINVVSHGMENNREIDIENRRY
jgi:hypothetical protein